jgi:carbamoyl-phosphate synthase large subunit
MISTLLLGAGGVAGINFVTSIRHVDVATPIIAMDTNRYHLKMVSHLVDACYLQTHTNREQRIEEINRLIDKHNIEFVHAQPDPEVLFLSENRDSINAKTFLPDKEAIKTCQDKRATAQRWNKAEVRTAWHYNISNEDSPTDLPENLEYPCWIRATRGAGGRGSTLATNSDTAYHWIKYWRSRGVSWEFIAEEYLPGRNIAVQTLWYDGDLITTVARERLEYIYPHAAPSGITGSSSVTRTIDDGLNLEWAAAKAVRAIDKHPHGAYGVDFKGDSNDQMQPTEINAGRFFTMSMLTSRVGNNMPYMFLRLAAGQEITSLGMRQLPPGGLYWLRHMDSPAQLVRDHQIDDCISKP